MSHQDGVKGDEGSNYAQTKLHFDMIKDEVRTMTYCEAIETNADEFKDKVVLDVGSGTGILSLFAARAGARKVYGVECTPMYKIAEQIIKDNNLDDKIVIIHGRLENITLPEKVDIIISEWMGYSLYFEVMLSSVIFARDHFLKDDGKLLPSKASLFLSAVQAHEYRAVCIDFWDSVYGFNFNAVKKMALTEPVIETVEPWQIMSDPCQISEIDLHTCHQDSSFFTSPFSLVCTKKDAVHALITWFDVHFSDMKVPHTLSTTPFSQPTHWCQTYFYLAEPLHVDAGDIIHGTVQFAQNPRDCSGLIVHISYALNDGKITEQQFDFR